MSQPTEEYETGTPDVVPDDRPPAPGEVLLDAEQIGVAASWGHIYGPVDLTVRAGGVTVLVGSGGRGRTSLLLTLAGRMKPTTGTLTAFGHVDDAHRLFVRAAMADIDEVDGIGQTIRVRDVVTEQLRWSAPWYRWVNPATSDDLERIARPVFGDLGLPAMEAMVEELPELTSALLRIALANVARPPLLVVGGVDNLASIESSRKLLDRLIVLGREQTVITADVNGVEPREGIREQIAVPNLSDFADLEKEALQS
ncbi:hypothetical protein LLS1_13500 [Leifsonia sp. LS1]|uniref:ATP-binding cassette domain-containing protein n=1 Tax=Leifsonia sp. LS1 TaxID=2828483 RepID=UPI001CFF20B7|nr:ATP-binding cassette domain-containing protein [Leifsonia sp. LS1]GIT79681.1 hypothetical protein LLS1_13500 [Leifsonia sp. LS1]